MLAEQMEKLLDLIREHGFDLEAIKDQLGLQTNQCAEKLIFQIYGKLTRTGDKTEKQRVDYDLFKQEGFKELVALKQVRVFKRIALLALEHGLKHEAIYQAMQDQKDHNPLTRNKVVLNFQLMKSMNKKGRFAEEPFCQIKDIIEQVFGPSKYLQDQELERKKEEQKQLILSQMQ